MQGGRSDGYTVWKNRIRGQATSEQHFSIKETGHVHRDTIGPEEQNRNPGKRLPLGVRPQLRIALVAMLTFCLIIRKRDHQKF